MDACICAGTCYQLSRLSGCPVMVEFLQLASPRQQEHLVLFVLVECAPAQNGILLCACVCQAIEVVEIEDHHRVCMRNKRCFEKSEVHNQGLLFVTHSNPSGCSIEKGRLRVDKYIPIAFSKLRVCFWKRSSKSARTSINIKVILSNYIIRATNIKRETF